MVSALAAVVAARSTSAAIDHDQDFNPVSA
jgi:hypothetical protein